MREITDSSHSKLAAGRHSCQAHLHCKNVVFVRFEFPVHSLVRLDKHIPLSRASSSHPLHAPPTSAAPLPHRIRHLANQPIFTYFCIVARIVKLYGWRPKLSATFVTEVLQLFEYCVKNIIRQPPLGPGYSKFMAEGLHNKFQVYMSSLPCEFEFTSR